MHLPPGLSPDRLSHPPPRPPAPHHSPAPPSPRAPSPDPPPRSPHLSRVVAAHPIRSQHDRHALDPRHPPAQQQQACPPLHPRPHPRSPRCLHPRPRRCPIRHPPCLSGSSSCVPGASGSSPVSSASTTPGCLGQTFSAWKLRPPGSTDSRARTAPPPTRAPTLAASGPLTSP